MPEGRAAPEIPPTQDPELKTPSSARPPRLAGFNALGNTLGASVIPGAHSLVLVLPFGLSLWTAPLHQAGSSRLGCSFSGTGPSDLSAVS